MAGPERSVPEDLLRQLAEEIRVWRRETLRSPAVVGGVSPRRDARDGDVPPTMWPVADATLAAYAAGALDPSRSKWVEEQLAGSPELAEVAAVVREALEQGDWQEAGTDLAPRLRLPLVLGPDAPPAPAAEPQPRLGTFWRVPRWAAVAALAAAFLVGIGVGALTIGPAVRDLFRVSTERLGGETDATLDSGITDSAAGNVRRGLSDLKDAGKQKDQEVHRGLGDLKDPGK
ncbi:MAG: hypothetical protein FJ290_12350 [Planctomycetes bacterium]|nr:hypothetical protein [Planctomycetota bacterium]